MVKRLTRRAFLPLTTALLLSSAVGAAPSAPARYVKHTTGFIESLAIDRAVVAYDVQGDQPDAPVCNRVYAWKLARTHATRVSGRGTCGADDSSTGSGVAQLAVSGSRVAWIVNVGGNSESADRLYTASLAAPKERRLAAVSRFGNVDCVLAGGWLGGLVGSGSLLAYDYWRTVAATPGDEGSCSTKVTSAALRGIERRGTTLLRSGADTLLASDADAGRIAVLHDDGTLTLLTSSGTPLRTLGIEPTRGIALAGSRIVVLTNAKRIQVYSATTGRAEASYAVPARADHLDAARGLAAYAVGRKLHVLRLATGRDTVVADAAKPITDVAASTRAVVYAYNVYKRLPSRATYRDIGNVVAIPVSQLPG
jgi:hypothetical protein